MNDKPDWAHALDDAVVPPRDDNLDLDAAETYRLAWLNARDERDEAQAKVRELEAENEKLERIAYLTGWKP